MNSGISKSQSRCDTRWLTPGVRGIGTASLLADLGHEVPAALPPESVDLEDGSVAAIETTRGSHESRAVVLAAGAWTAALARLAGTRIPLQPGKGYHIHIGNGAPKVRVPIIFQESVFAAAPMSGELRLAGTMEFVGFDTTLTRTATDRMLEEARLYLDGLEAVAAGET